MGKLCNYPLELDIQERGLRIPLNICVSMEKYWTEHYIFISLSMPT